MLGLAPFLVFLIFSWLATAETNITAEDNQIIWPSSSPPWSGTATVCSSQGQAHFAFRANMSMSYEFTGTAIYIRILRSNVTGAYTVSIDGSTPVLIDGFHSATICDIQFGQAGLPFRPHTLIVELFGPSPQTQNASSPIFLEIDAFIYTTPDGSSPSNSSTSDSSTSTGPIPTITGPSTASSTGTSSIQTPAIAGIVIALIASFVAVAAFFFFLRRRKTRSSTARRLTILDVDSVFRRHSVFPGRVSQFPPRADLNRTHHAKSSSDMPLIYLTELTNAESQSSSQSQWRMSGTTEEEEDAPPEYQAPGTKDALRVRSN